MTRVGRRGLILGPVTIKDGPSGPVNTVAPAIPASAVIGTQLVTTPGTWTGATTLTYQWQRNTGSWGNIAGATSANYTPVDADFGYALRVVETADGAVSANSNETGLTAEAPAQSLGAELVVNGDFSAWTSDNPDGWSTVNEIAPNREVTQRGAGQTHADPPGGTGYANIYNNLDTTSNPQIRQAVLTAGTYYEASMDINAIASLGAGLQIGFISGMTTTAAALGISRIIGRAAGTQFFIARLGTSLGTTDITIDNVSCKPVTLNTQLTAPSADMTLAQYYTLPGSPVAGDAIRMLLRISDFSAGNYWMALLEYTGSQWDITLFSVATHTRTSRIAATNIGASNGLRVTMNADSITLETTANGGTDWTSRGSVANSTYQAATGVNSLWTSSVTAGQLVFANP